MATDPSPGAGDGTPGVNPPPTHLSDSSSPEFEFWKARAVTEPALLSADELFADGVVLPLRLLRETGTTHLRAEAVKPEEAAGSVTVLRPEPPAEQPLPSTSSKRWKDIIISFRRGGEKKSEGAAAEELERDGDRLMMGKSRKKKLERKSGATGAGAADLNINIWPFARSRSAGTGAASRPRAAAAPGGPPRKASSAPCSRSNSAGESKSKKWPASPGRAPLAGGVHLGRSSPVWQVRRGVNGAKPGADSGSRTSRRGTTDGGGVSSNKGRVLNLNVPLCIGYRHNLSCSSDNDGAAVAQAAGRLNAGASGAGNGNGNGNGGNNGSLFNFRSLFSKKVY